MRDLIHSSDLLETLALVAKPTPETKVTIVSTIILVMIQTPENPQMETGIWVRLQTPGNQQIGAGKM